MFKATQIEIKWTEAGPFDGLVITAGEGRESIWEKVDALFEMFTTMNEGRGYLKTAFIVTFEDGDTYEGQIDLKVGEKNSLAEHIRAYAKNVIEMDLSWISEDQRLAAKHFIENYKIGA